MPWCENCARFFNPPSMGTGGECPSCGSVIGPKRRAPWHFKTLVAAASLYLGWRAIEGVDWLVRQLF